MTKSIRIGILESPLWDTVLEFSVELEDKGLKNCQLGRYLYRARVKLLDHHTFPSNKYAEEINKQQLDEIGLSLLFEYIKMNWKTHRWVTIKVILSAQINNVDALFLMFINVYLIDYVLNSAVEPESLFIVEDHFMSLCVIVGLRLTLFLMSHFLEYWAISLGLPGLGKKLLQTRLLRRFISCEDGVHVTIRASHIITAMTRDAEVVVDNGYAPLARIASVAGKLCVILVYQVSAPIIFHKKFRPIMTIVPMIVLPVCVCAFIVCREAETRRLLRVKNTAEDEFVDHISDTIDNYGLITGYYKRDRCVEQFDEVIKRMNGARKAAVMRNCNNGKFAVLMTQIMVAVWTVLGGMLVLRGDMKLGIYLTQLAIFNTLGEVWLAIYQNIQDMITCGPSIRKVTQFMNLPFDLDERMTINRIRRKAIKDNKQLTKTSGGFLTFDMLPIEVTDAIVSRDLGIPGQMQIKQGEFITLLGPRGSGKASLLRLLGGSLLPEMSSLQGNGGSSILFIPSHLRVLHIPPDPLFFLGSLYDNLAYGVAKGDPDMNINRVINICKLLDLPPHVLEYVERQDLVEVWPSKFSASELSLLNLTRAFITNPEVLCIHRPTNIMDEPTSLRVMRLFRVFVEEKGLEMDSRKWHLRRPRTCVITSNKAISAQIADRTYILTKYGGLKALSGEEVDGLTKDPQCMTESGMAAFLEELSSRAKQGKQKPGIMGKLTGNKS
jgi:ABC-type multidrug transport system fused ATPase/permease subunit